MRFTAPSLILEGGGVRLVAGGWQTVEAYDVLVANLDPGLERREPPPGVEPLLARFPHRDAAEAALVAAVGEGRAIRTPLGDDALWRAV